MAAGDRYPARRVPVGDFGAWMDDLRPGDYYGPVVGYSGEPAVFFVLPREVEGDPNRAIRHIVSPPHRFRECPDGSLEVRESIGCPGPGGPGSPYVWHGYLDEGQVWREV